MMLELIQILDLRECSVHHSRQIYLIYRCINIIIINNYTYEFLNSKYENKTFNLHGFSLSEIKFFSSFNWTTWIPCVSLAIKNCSSKSPLSSWIVRQSRYPTTSTIWFSFNSLVLISSGFILYNIKI